MSGSARERVRDVRLTFLIGYVLADAGYDSNDLADAVEIDQQQQRTGRRLLCPYPRHRSGTSTGDHRETHCRKRRRTRRQQRAEFFSRPFAQKLIRRRGTRVEPFNDWLKTRFDLHDRIWHRGLNNNRPQLLAAIFADQLLLFHNHTCHHNNAQLQSIINTL
ncbi:MAG: transposase [Planctomycetaceae bacterium]